MAQNMLECHAWGSHVLSHVHVHDTAACPHTAAYPFVCSGVRELRYKCSRRKGKYYLDAAMQGGDQAGK